MGNFAVPGEGGGGAITQALQSIMAERGADRRQQQGFDQADKAREETLAQQMAVAVQTQLQPAVASGKITAEQATEAAGQGIAGLNKVFEGLVPGNAAEAEARSRIDALAALRAQPGAADPESQEAPAIALRKQAAELEAFIKDDPRFSISGRQRMTAELGIARSAANVQRFERQTKLDLSDEEYNRDRTDKRLEFNKAKQHDFDLIRGREAAKYGLPPDTRWSVIKQAQRIAFDPKTAKENQRRMEGTTVAVDRLNKSFGDGGYDADQPGHVGQLISTITTYTSHMIPVPAVFKNKSIPLLGSDQFGILSVTPEEFRNVFLPQIFAARNDNDENMRLWLTYSTMMDLDNPTPGQPFSIGLNIASKVRAYELDQERQKEEAADITSRSPETAEKVRVLAKAFASGQDDRAPGILGGVRIRLTGEAAEFDKDPELRRRAREMAAEIRKGEAELKTLEKRTIPQLERAIESAKGTRGRGAPSRKKIEQLEEGLKARRARLKELQALSARARR